MLYWNEKQSLRAIHTAYAVVIWCSIEMRNSSPNKKKGYEIVVIWCSIEMRNSRIRHETLPVWLWFDALLKWETVGAATAGDRGGCGLMLYWNEKQYGRSGQKLFCVVIWCSIEMRNSERLEEWRSQELWFDALLKWETVRQNGDEPDRGCDLMLYWNEKQYLQDQEWRNAVVIWCSIEMRNSFFRVWCVLLWLWFDALLKWETVLHLKFRTDGGCDLMLYWNEKQFTVCLLFKSNGCDLMLYWNEKQYTILSLAPNVRCDLMLYWNEKQFLALRTRANGVVIWCSIEMRNSHFLPFPNMRNVVIWCSIEMRNSSAWEAAEAARVVIWCSIEMRNSCSKSV